MKFLVKYIFNIFGLIIISPFLPLRFLINGISFFVRSIYSQWKRMELSHSHIGMVVSYPCEIRGGKYISCGKNTFLGPNGILSAWDSFQGEKYKPKITIGDNVTIGMNFHISAINRISIGDNVLTGKGITIIDNGHGKTTLEDLQIAPKSRKLFVYGSVSIGKNVWIGDKVTIVGNVNIGEGAVIGSNSVVTKDVPPFSVCGGVPAKIIKQL